MAVVVRPPDVDGQVEAPHIQLVPVVGDVGGEVGIEAVGPAQHVVLQVQLVHLLLTFALPHVFLLEQLSGVQPQGPVLLIGPALVGEQPHRLGHIAGLVEGGLQEPLIILDAVLAQVLLHPGDIHRQAVLGHGPLPVLPGGLAGELPRLGQKAPGQLPDVVPVVPLLGEGVVLLPHRQLHAAGVDGGGKFMDLVAGVVDIELLPGVPAIPLQHVGQGVPQHASPGVAHVHGAGGVGGDKLHHHLFSAPLGARAVAKSLVLHGGQDLPEPPGAQGEIEKAGSGNLHLLEIAALQLQVVRDDLGDLPGGHVQGPGPRHGKGGGVIPVGGVLWNLDGGADLRPGGEQSRPSRLFVCRLGQLGHLLPGGLNHVRHKQLVLFNVVILR